MVVARQPRSAGHTRAAENWFDGGARRFQQVRRFQTQDYNQVGCACLEHGHVFTAKDVKMFRVPASYVPVGAVFWAGEERVCILILDTMQNAFYSKAHCISASKK